jgi:hypothetical protein
MNSAINIEISYEKCCLMISRSFDLQPVGFPLAIRPWDNPIDTTSPMRRQRRNPVSPVEREELNRHLKYDVDVGLV